eukprot:gene7759-9549_t
MKNNINFTNEPPPLPPPSQYNDIKNSDEDDIGKRTIKKRRNSTQGGNVVSIPMATTPQKLFNANRYETKRNQNSTTTSRLKKKNNNTFYSSSDDDNFKVVLNNFRKRKQQLQQKLSDEGEEEDKDDEDVYFNSSKGEEEEEYGDDEEASNEEEEEDEQDFGIKADINFTLNNLSNQFNDDLDIYQYSDESENMTELMELRLQEREDWTDDDNDQLKNNNTNSLAIVSHNNNNSVPNNKKKKKKVILKKPTSSLLNNEEEEENYERDEMSDGDGYVQVEDNDDEDIYDNEVDYGSDDDVEQLSKQQVIESDDQDDQDFIRKTTQSSSSSKPPVIYKKKTLEEIRQMREQKKSSVTEKQRKLLEEEERIRLELEKEEKERERQYSIFINARNNLHISRIPENLPGREKEKAVISNFIESKLLTNDSGGCLYIAGMPGTGKTTTVKEVIRNLQAKKKLKEIPPFQYYEINGMELNDPHNLYSVLYRKMYKKKKARITPQNALHHLHKIFNSKSRVKPFRVLLVDEFDQLVTKRQTVIYNLFEWPNKPISRLIIIAIANTMNLPDTLLPRVQSRMGLQRVSFSSYNVSQLETIVKSRLKGLEAFDQDAIQICAMRVSAVSGDARRALEICRRAATLADFEHKKLLEQQPNALPGKVTASHIEKVLDLFSTPIVFTIKNCSFYEKIFLFSFYKEQKQSGQFEIQYGKICDQLKTLCRIHQLQTPNRSQLAQICGNLGGFRLLLVKDALIGDYEQLMKLNFSLEDLLLAFSQDPQLEKFLANQ